MITLNNINLSSIDLSGIDLRGIKLGLGGRGSGSSDGFPVLPGDVTRWHFGGLTNEMMAAMDDPRIEDADHKGRFLSFKNFAWGEMSGVGGYTQNYNYSAWRLALDRAEITKTGHSFNVTSVTSTVVAFYYQSGSGQEPFTVKSQIVRVSGLTDGQSIKYGTGKKSVLVIESDGIYTLPPFDFAAKGIWYGFSFGKIQESCNITLEQLPYYPDALVFDGVDDYGICDNFPILTKESGYTVIGLRHILNDAPGAWISKRTVSPNTGAFAVDLTATNLVSYANTFGKSNVVSINKNNAFVYQTSTSYMENPIIQGENPDNNALVIGAGLLTLSGGSIVGAREYVKCSIHELVILDHDATEEELAKIKEYYMKQYPWLFFDQAWTVVGKSNEDTDRATIANITGNDNNLALQNFGFIEGSGYNEEGEYAGYLVTDGVDDTIVSSSFGMGKDFTIIGDWKFMDNIIANAGISKALSLFVYNTNNGLRIFINNATKGPVLNTKTLKAICSDGRVYSDDWSEMIINEEQPITSSKSSLLIGINGNNFAKIALKNLAIYNQILSKDDCTKAYNYLQTLKAK